MYVFLNTAFTIIQIRNQEGEHDMSAIKSFTGQYRFLSNFYPCGIRLDGMYYPSVEHAFQAAKTFDIRERKSIAVADTPDYAKSLGKKVKLRDDWESVKGQIMLDLLRAKFSDEILKQKLLDTGDAELIEAKKHGDRFWGQVNGEGKNLLGKLLMRVRNELRDGNLNEKFDCCSC